VKVFNTVRGKYILVTLIVATFLAIVLSLIYYQRQYQAVQFEQSQSLHAFGRGFDSRVNLRLREMDMGLEGILNDQSIIEDFAMQNRESLSSRLIPLYKNSLKPKFDIKQFQFHLPPATSFYRIHKPGKYGDDLSKKRATVVQANKYKKQVTGFDVGPFGMGLRVVKPLSWEGQHIGTVEFGSNFGQILSSMNKTFQLRYALGVKKSVFDQVGRKAKEGDINRNDHVYLFSSDDDVPDLLEVPRKFGIVSEQITEDADYILSSYPIKGIDGSVVGELFVAKDISEGVVKLKRDSFNMFIVVWLITIVISLTGTILMRPVFKGIENIREYIDEFARYVSFRQNQLEPLNINSTRDLNDVADSLNVALDIHHKNQIEDLKIIGEFLLVAGKVSEGHYSNRLTSTSHNHMTSALVRAFNQMLDITQSVVEQTRDRLQDFQNGNYQNKVNTGELSGQMLDLVNGVNALGGCLGKP
jgi:methyl-accepting chemotaxis protein